jgi:hypothetical protein
MPISQLLLPEFDNEMKTARITLERVPFEKKGFAHAKSMPLPRGGRQVGSVCQG